MSVQVYSVPGQTEGRRKAFLEWKSIDVFCELSVTCGGNANHYKSIHHPIPFRGNRENPGNFQNKLVNSPFNWVPSYMLSLAKLKGRGRPFFKGARRGGGAHCKITPQEHLVVIRNEKISPVVKFEIILTLLCFLLDPLTKKHLKSCESSNRLFFNVAIECFST